MIDIILWDPVFWVGGTNRANATAHMSKLLNIYVFGFNNNTHARNDSIFFIQTIYSFKDRLQYKMLI